MKTWRSIPKEDLNSIGLSLEDAFEVVLDRGRWGNSG